MLWRLIIYVYLKGYYLIGLKKKKVSSLPALKTVNSVKARMAFYTSFLQPAMSNGKAKHNFFLVG